MLVTDGGLTYYLLQLPATWALAGGYTASRATKVHMLAISTSTTDGRQHVTLLVQLGRDKTNQITRSYSNSFTNVIILINFATPDLYYAKCEHTNILFTQGPSIYDVQQNLTATA